MVKKIFAGALCLLMTFSFATPVFALSVSSKRHEVVMLGDEDSYVLEIQKALQKQGLFKVTPTSYYGEITQKSIIEFQKKNNLQVDGKAGNETRRKLLGSNFKAIPSSRKVGSGGSNNTFDSYAPGDRGKEVSKIQSRLKELGYYKYSSITEFFGPITEQAAKNFKKNNGLSSSNGVLDKTAYDLLFSSKAKKASAGNNNPSAPSASSKIETMIDTAEAKIGKKYVLGATGPNSFDCSGLIVYALNSVGKSGPRTSAAQSKYTAWDKVSYENLKRGDFVFFASPSNSSIVGHCGIYLGDGKFIHATSGSAYSVTISTMSSGSYRSRFFWGRRAF